MKLKRIVCLVISIAAAASMFLVKDSVAWFDTSTGEAIGQNITIKKMFFDFEGELGTYLVDPNTDTSVIVPGQNLLVGAGNRISAVNYSTIATEVRVLIEYEKNDGISYEYAASASDAVVAVFADGWAKGGADNYFYKSFPLTDGTGTPVDILTSLSYDVGNEYASSGSQGGSDVIVDVSITIQAKQQDYLTWTTVASF